VAAATLAARRLLVATRVGGLAEQAAGDPAAVLCDVSVDGLVAALRQMVTMEAPVARPEPGQGATAKLAEELRQAVRK
jgi:hypothetical protein